MDISQRILSDLTVFMKYAKYIPSKQRRETWQELIERNKEMHINKFPYLVEEIEEAYKFVYDKKVLPSMRSLQFAGKPIEINPTRIYNCFKRNTKFITSIGVKSFEDFNDGDEIVVLSPDGTWQPARVKQYGKQPLSKLTFIKNKSEKTVYATNNHRWILSDGSDTTSIKIGDKLLPVTDTFSNFNYEEADPIQGMYWVLRDIQYNVEYEDVWCLEVENTRAFVLSGGLSTGNCAFLPIDDWRAFSETMFLLLGGTGVGFSVQNHHVEKLPEIRKPRKDRRRRWLVGDSIEGWADAIKVLMKSYFQGGATINFDFGDIRPKGSRLVTSGGKAPGPQPLKECLVKIEGILSSKEDGDKLRPIEVHDIICHIADAVLAGGIRRAALISLFNADDDEMISCKSGNWWELNPQRGRANNSAVLLRHKVTKEYFLDLWKRIKNSNSGEPGIYLSNDKTWGTNPSLRAGTRVWTNCGIFPIEELQDKVFLVTNLEGQLSPAKCWLSGNNQKLWEITLEGGHKYYATKEHEWAVKQPNGTFLKVKTQHLKKGDKFPNIIKSELGFGFEGTYDEGFLCGWHLGDGWTTVRKEGYLQHGLICTEKDGIKDKLIECLRGIGVNANLISRGTSYELNTSDKDWERFQERFEYSNKREGLPKTVWNRASESFRKGLIDALFSSNGIVETGVKKRITFTTANEAMAKDISDLLGFYGIKTNLSKSISMIENTEYTIYDVSITGKSNIEHFRSVFKLSVEYKQNLLDEFVWENKSVYDNSTIKVISVMETDLEEDVWDISVMDETHCFQISHSITGNCCEIALRPFQFCNLVEINASDVETQEELNKRVAAATFLGTLQASYTDFHYLRPIWKRTTEKDALLGVSMTGIGSGKVLNLDLEEAAEVANQVNLSYAARIGINYASRITTVKPAGTSSLVFGTSSGIHAWHDSHYIRRIRVNKNEAIYTYLSIHHPELIEDEYFRPHDTAVISIPQKAPEGSILRHESPIDLLERVKLFYNTWVSKGHHDGQNTHNISATVSIKPDEWEIVGEWMWQNRDSYNGLSVLPYDSGTYIQSPFETITEEKYEELMKTLRAIDLSKVVEFDDETNLQGELACSGGQCEVK
jgi:hypothetical protein